MPKIDGEISVFLDSECNKLIYKDGSYVLTDDSNTGEYVYPKTDIYAMGIVTSEETYEGKQYKVLFVHEIQPLIRWFFAWG